MGSQVGHLMVVALFLCAVALWCAAKAFDDLAREVHRISHKENRIMALGQEILDAVTAETSVLDSFLALIQGLIANGTVTPEQGQAILAAIAENKAKIEKAITDNTPAAS